MQLADHLFREWFSSSKRVDCSLTHMASKQKTHTNLHKFTRILQVVNIMLNKLFQHAFVTKPNKPFGLCGGINFKLNEKYTNFQHSLLCFNTKENKKRELFIMCMPM